MAPNIVSATMGGSKVAQVTASVFSDWLAAIVEAVCRLELHEERQWRIGDNPVYVGRLEGLGQLHRAGDLVQPSAQRSLPDTEWRHQMANFRCRSATLRSPANAPLM